MKKTVYRFGFAISVLIVGILIVIAFTLIGDKSKGPLSELFSKLESKAIDIESNYLLSKREPVRSNELKWFNKYRHNKELIRSLDTIIMGVYDNHYQKSFENIIKLEEKLSFANPLHHYFAVPRDSDKGRSFHDQAL